jgi:hypothetical protein
MFNNQLAYCLFDPNVVSLKRYPQKKFFFAKKESIYKKKSFLPKKGSLGSLSAWNMALRP